MGVAGAHAAAKALCPYAHAGLAGYAELASDDRAFREVYHAAKPIILEPIMTVEVVAPSEFQSASCFRSFSHTCR